jgi:hypothetical protein
MRCHPQTYYRVLALNRLLRTRGWSIGVTDRKETILIEKG